MECGHPVLTDERLAQMQELFKSREGFANWSIMFPELRALITEVQMHRQSREG